MHADNFAFCFQLIHDDFFCGQNKRNIILFNKIELLEGKCCAFFEGHHILLSN